MKHLKTMTRFSWLFILAMIFYGCGGDDEPVVGQPPLADAGADIDAFVGSSVTLNGTNSSDPDGGSLSYAWELTQVPSGSDATISGNTSANASFTPDVAGTYTARLIVTDEDGNTDDDNVLINAEDDGAPGVETIIIDEDIDSDVVWEDVFDNPDRADYRITKDILNVNAVITVEPGVVVEMAENVAIWVRTDGRLNAIGTSNQQIRFTGTQKTKGFWREITFDNSISVQNRFEYVTFEYGGGGTFNNSDEPVAMVFLYGQYSSSGAAASFINCTFKESASYGIGTSAREAIDFNEFSNNQFENNDLAAITTSLRIATRIDAGSSFTNNGLNGAILESNTLNSEGNLPAIDYEVAEDIVINARLEIAEGAKFVFNEARNMTVGADGVLVANGTEQDEIIFEGAQNTPGFWGGVLFDNSKSVDNQLSYVRISDGGNRDHGGFGFNLAVGGSYSGNFSEVKISNSTFTNSSDYGLVTRRKPSSLPDFSNNTFDSNATGAIMLDNVEQLRFMDGDSDLGSTNNFILVGANAGTGNYTETAGDWPKLLGTGYYVFDSDATIQSAITIEAGADLRFNENILFEVNGDGTMEAIGTSGDQITFSSNRDDNTIFWDGIFFNNSNSVDNEMQYCIVENAGRNQATSSTGQANISVGGQYSGNMSTLNITNSIIRHGAGAGISVRSGSTLNADAATVNTFENLGDVEVKLP